MNTNKLLENEYLTVMEVRKYLNISQSAAYQLTRRRDFPVCRFGGSIRIPRDAFLVWVKEKTYVPGWMHPVA